MRAEGDTESHDLEIETIIVKNVSSGIECNGDVEKVGSSKAKFGYDCERST
jgi:hypothetical protein